MNANAKHKSCESRIDRELAGRLADLKRLWATFIEGRDDDALGT